MRKLIFGSSLLLILASLVSGDSFSGGGGGGTTVTVAAPYVTIGGTKYVAATMWPFTAFFSGSFLDAVTSTLTAGANGSELVSCACNNQSSWYGESATTSVEAEILGFSDYTATTSLASGSPSVGVWICDTTNGKLYALEIVNASGANTQQFIQFSSWTLAACSGTPSAASVLVVNPVATNGILHFKMSKVGGNLITQISNDGGQTFSQLDSRAVGTLAKAGVSARHTTAIATNVNLLVLSISIT